MADARNTGGNVRDLRSRVVALEGRKDTSADVTAEAQARVAGDKVNSDAIAAEAASRAAGDKASGDAMTAEAKARSDADKATNDRLVKFTATLSLAAGLSLLVGKTPRTIPVTGLIKGDVLTVTAKTALPGNLSLGDAYCLDDGVLSLALINTGLLGLSISAKTDIPLGIVAHR